MRDAVESSFGVEQGEVRFCLVSLGGAPFALPLPASRCEWPYMMGVIAVEVQIFWSWIETIVASQIVRACGKTVDDHGRRVLAREVRDHVMLPHVAVADVCVLCFRGACGGLSRCPHLIALCSGCRHTGEPTRRPGLWECDPADSSGLGSCWQRRAMTIDFEACRRAGEC